MGRLTILRGMAHILARLTVRPGRGGHPTDRWQDKSREVRRGRSAEEAQTHQALCTRRDCARQPANSHSSLEDCNYVHLACARVMTRDDDLRVRIGRIRDKGSARRAKPFIAQALAAAEKAGGLHRRSGRGARSAAFGRGRAASLAATRLMTNRTRSVTVKARVVRQRARGAALSAHLAYLRREGVTKDGAAGRLFDAEHDDADHRAFAERCEGDRHHFRFIVSPQDAEQLSDLKAFTRDLMAQAERDLGTKLDWVGVDHWNTDNPHIHVIVRGKGDDGRDLVIARDYISQGMRARAAHLATLELGPRSDLEIRRDLDAQVEADRWTKLDRALAREAAQHDGVIDLRPGVDARADAHARTALIGRMQKLERLGLAEAARSGAMAPVGECRAHHARAGRADRHHQAHPPRACRSGHRTERR